MLANLTQRRQRTVIMEIILHHTVSALHVDKLHPHQVTLHRKERVESGIVFMKTLT